MTIRLRIGALALAAALAACGKKTHTTPGFLLSEPSAVAVFRGITSKDANLHPYLAIANPGSNELTIVDGVDDSIVPSRVELRTLVFPVPGRPALLASASLGDGGADLLVAVSAGDSNLQLVRTWANDGKVVAEVLLGGDALALVAVPSAQGTARIAAALSGGQLVVVTFTRSTSGDGTGIDPPATPPEPTALGFQPLALAVIPGDQSMVWAATRDPLPLSGSKYGVAGIDIKGTPVVVQELDALAPTRLVAAAQLWERTAGSTSLGADAFNVDPAQRVQRVYAILDESGCGLNAPIACGLVALDPSLTTTVALAPDPTPLGTMHAPFRAPIPIPGTARALAATQPPAVLPPDLALDPAYAGTLMRMVTAAGTRITTAAAAVASTDGYLYFVDLGRWEIPGEQTVKPTATTSAAVNPEASASNLRVTAGYTPDATWTATWRGELPGLASRRAESGQVSSGVPWLALQVTTEDGFGEVARVYDPTLGVHVGDIAVIEFSDGDRPPVETCAAATFEATVDELLTPLGHEAEYPGGALRLGKVADHQEWIGCVEALAVSGRWKGLRASVRAGGWVLVRGTGAAAALVGRPEVGTEFPLQWESEALSCPVWPPVTSCDATCRSDCERLMRARLARRVGYVPTGDEAQVADPQGPSLAFTLGLRSGLTEPSRGFAVVITTTEGRGPFRSIPSGSGIVAAEPSGISVFDRSSAAPDTASAGVRFLVPYQSNVVLDATPTIQGGNPIAIH